MLGAAATTAMKRASDRMAGSIAGSVRGIAANRSSSAVRSISGERRQETKRRFQRRVKSVFARLVGELRPFGRAERDVLRMAQPFARVAVIAEDAGAEAIERAIGRRHEI